MGPVPQSLLTFGALLVLGLGADALGRRVGVPRVTLLILLGLAVGPAALDLLPTHSEHWFPVVSTLALTMIGFLLGQSFTLEHLREHGVGEFVLALVQGVITAVVVGFGLVPFGIDPVLAVLLGGVAVATDPAATLAVLDERGADGPFSRRLRSVAALDDVVGISLFGFLIAGAAMWSGSGSPFELLGEAGWELGGAALVGMALGIPAALLTGRLRPGEPTREEAFAIVLLCAGLALWAHVSYLLSAVVAGALVANLARHHERPFKEIERIEWPFLVIFFVLAGASLEVEALSRAGLVAGVYVLLRAAGKLLGCILGTVAIERTVGTGPWLGMAMLPQAGVALGLMLLAAERFPSLASQLIPAVLVGTVVFELVGPLLTSVALRRVGEAGGSPSAGETAEAG